MAETTRTPPYGRVWTTPEPVYAGKKQKSIQSQRQYDKSDCNRDDHTYSDGQVCTTPDPLYDGGKQKLSLSQLQYDETEWNRDESSDKALPWKQWKWPKGFSI